MPGITTVATHNLPMLPPAGRHPVTKDLSGWMKESIAHCENLLTAVAADDEKTLNSTEANVLTGRIDLIRKVGHERLNDIGKGKDVDRHVVEKWLGEVANFSDQMDKEGIKEGSLTEHIVVEFLKLRLELIEQNGRGRR